LLFAGAAKEVLTPFLDRPADATCFSPRETVDDLRSSLETARFAKGRTGKRKKPVAADSGYGDRYSAQSYWRAIDRACEAAKVPHWYPYQLRHLAAAEIQELYGLDAVQALLGHHTKSMAEHYAGAAVKTAAEVAKARGGAKNEAAAKATG
jgi:integrase